MAIIYRCTGCRVKMGDKAPRRPTIAGICGHSCCVACFNRLNSTEGSCPSCAGPLLPEDKPYINNLMLKQLTGHYDQDEDLTRVEVKKINQHYLRSFISVVGPLIGGLFCYLSMSLLDIVPPFHVYFIIFFMVPYIFPDYLVYSKNDSITRMFASIVCEREQ